MADAATHMPKTARGEQTRQRLLDAAERVFGLKGYHDASIVDLTREAGVAMGTFYIYFPDKRALFEELVRHLNRRLRAHLREAVAASGGVTRLDAERAGLLAFIEFVRQHAALYRIIRQAEFVDEALYRWHYQTLAQSYARGLSAAMAQGEVRPLDPEALAYCLMAISEMFGMRWPAWEGHPPPAAALETAMTLIARGIAPDPPRPAAASGDGQRHASAEEAG